MAAQDDLDLVFGRIHPKEAREWLSDKIQEMCPVKWSGPSIDCELSVPITGLDFAISALGRTSFNGVSIEAVREIGLLLKKVREQLSYAIGELRE